MTNKQDKILAAVCVVILIFSIGFFSYIKGEEEEETSSADTMLEATNVFLAKGKSTMITAEALYANLDDGFTGNDPFILSVRNESQYAIGHIPGAVIIPWRSVFTEENLSKLPTNKQIVVYCFTGHTASQITALLNVNGYDAVCLKWGMCSWTTNTTVAPSYYDRATASNNYPVFIGDQPGSWEDGAVVGKDIRCGDEPAPTDTDTVVEDTGDLRAIVHSYLSAGKPPAMKASVLFDKLNDTDTSNDPFILSVRSSTQYAVGHIPGAINIGFSSLFTEENLAKLPDDDTQIVVVCYTGHTASQATAFLNVNGYNAIALKWGMTSWTNNVTVAPSYYNRGSACKNYPVVIGSSEGSLDTAEIVGKTDEELLAEAASTYLGGGSRFTKTSDLYDLLNDTDDTNDPFILDIRSSSVYEKGHIPGAVFIPSKSVFSIENLSLLPDDDTHIVVVCHTGQTASQITALLNVLGYNASTLAHGMGAWTRNATAAPVVFDSTTHQSDYPISDGSEPGEMATATTRSNGCGDDGGGTAGTYEASSDEWEIIRQAADRYVNEATMLITAKALYNNLNDNYSNNDPYILSIRNAENYTIGHIPTAENIGSTVLFNEQNLAELPIDRQIVVYCFTGQGAGHVSAMLNINGYNAISLKFGMCSWTDNTTIAIKCYNPGENYPVIMNSDEQGDWDSGIVATADR